METKKIIERNAELQEKLEKPNKDYYGNLLVYIRIMSFIRDEKKSEELLLEILEDIVEGQSKGITAEQYLGANPKQVADDIIKELPINVMDLIKLIASGLGMYYLFTLIPSLVTSNTAVDIGNFLITGIYIFFLIIVGLMFMAISLYRYTSKVLKILLPVVFTFGLMGGVLLFSNFKTSWVLKVSDSMGLLLIGSSLFFIICFLYKTDDKKSWAPFVPPILISAIAGILLRIESFKPIFNTQNGKYILTAVLLVGLVLQYLFIRYFAKKRK